MQHTAPPYVTCWVKLSTGKLSKWWMQCSRSYDSETQLVVHIVQHPAPPNATLMQLIVKLTSRSYDSKRTGGSERIAALCTTKRHLLSQAFHRIQSVPVVDVRFVTSPMMLLYALCCGMFPSVVSCAEHFKLRCNLWCAIRQERTT